MGAFDVNVCKCSVDTCAQMCKANIVVPGPAEIALNTEIPKQAISITTLPSLIILFPLNHLK